MNIPSAILVTLIATSAVASTPSLDLQTYLDRAFPLCPDSKVQLEQLQVVGPHGFVPYRVRLVSSSQGCGRETFALFSPATKQVLIADVFTLPADARRVEARIAEVVERLLKKQAVVTLSGTVLEDGLRRVTVTAPGKEGPFDFEAFLDGSQSFLILGRRGRLDVDPRKSLIDSLPTRSAARRGKADAAIKVIEISDFQCPSCKHAHDLLEDLIRANLGRISYTRIDLPIYEGHDWAIQAALAARAIQRVSPENYWNFVDYIFDNQEAIKRELVDRFIQDFVEDHDIDVKKFNAIYRAPAERKAMIDQVESLFNLGISGTPTFVINGQEVYYGKEGSHLKQYLQRLLKKK